MQSRLQLLFLTFLRRLIVSVRQLLRLAATITLNPSAPLQHDPELDVDIEKLCDHERYAHRDTSALPRKSLLHRPRAVYDGIPALVNISLPTSLGEDRPGEDQPGETFSRRASRGAKLRTRPTLDSKLPKNGTTRLQRAHALLTWLIRFYLHFTSPRQNAEAVVPTAGSIAHSLIWVSRWLKSALVPIYPSTDLWDLGLENDQPFSADRMTSELVEETAKPLPRRASSQPQPPKTASQVPGASALCKTYFIPANSSLVGAIEKPKGSPICAGGYSDVWRCNIRFSTPSEGLPPQVAVKVLRSVWLSNRNDADANERKLRRFIQEVITWIGLPEHPNIVPLIGWTLTPDLSFVSPWYKQGNLYRHLKNLSDTRRIRILLGIAKGLECLHSRNPPVVHGDLKPENILMSDGGEPLLADFGLSTILGEERMYTSSHRVGGSVPWMSPEQVMEGLRSCQSDVYSFGSLAFTVMTGEMPYAGLTDGQITLKVCNSKDPKDPIDDWSKYPHLGGPIQALLKDCWSRSPDARPSMTAIVQRLTTLLESSGLI